MGKGAGTLEQERRRAQTFTVAAAIHRGLCWSGTCLGEAKVPLGRTSVVEEGMEGEALSRGGASLLQLWEEVSVEAEAPGFPSDTPSARLNPTGSTAKAPSLREKSELWVNSSPTKDFKALAPGRSDCRRTPGQAAGVLWSWPAGVRVQGDLGRWR